MRRRFRRPKKFKPIVPRYRVNRRILSPRVFVIAEGGPMGEMDTAQAIAAAEEMGMDLVEVSPKENPPVCRIADFGKFQYHQAKKEQNAKTRQKKVEIKGIRIGLRTDSHDIGFKKRQAEKFLKRGDKVRIEILLRGREKAHSDIARENLHAFITQLETPHTIEEDIKRFPRGFHILVAPQ